MRKFTLHGNQSVVCPPSSAVSIGVQDIWGADDSGLPLIHAEEFDGSKRQVTVRARMGPARALPRMCGSRQKKFTAASHEMAPHMVKPTQSSRRC